MENDFIKLHDLQDGQDTYVRFARIIAVQNLDNPRQGAGSIIRLCSDSSGPIYVQETFQQVALVIDEHVRRIARESQPVLEPFGEVLA